jgi:hypothetical protein
MRTRTLRRWVVGLFAAATLGLGAVSAVEIMLTTQDAVWTVNPELIGGSPQPGA